VRIEGRADPSNRQFAIVKSQIDNLQSNRQSALKSPIRTEIANPQ
jgi:hypothetical protein